MLTALSPLKINNFGWIRLPNVEIPEKVKTENDFDSSISNIDFIKSLATKKLKEKLLKIDESKHQIYFDYLEKELELVSDLGFIDYYILVWLVINKAREAGGFIDWGRGSCAASIIFWAIDVTGVDPIDKGLILERFLNRTRAKKQIIDDITYIYGELAPDVDINLGGIRDKVVEWLFDTYKGKIARIIALSSFTGKILVKDVYKCKADATEEQAKDIADTVDKHFGIVEDLSEMVHKSVPFKKWSEKYPDVFRTCLKLRNLIRQKTSHASGYLISDKPLHRFLPLELNKDKEISVGFEMRDVCHFGLKLDLLGLICNEIIKEVQSKIPAEEVNLDDDPFIYDKFQKGDLLPYGIYQVSANCMFNVVNKIKPKNIFELSDCSAIARPGALDYLDTYKDGDGKTLHPKFDKILSQTRNVCLYQEQMMRLLMAVGFTAEEAEVARKIVGKKEIEKVKEWEKKIKDKCKENGLEDKIGDSLWKILLDSSRYSFNKSHSVATSYLSSYTLYLKYKYPLQFYTACLNAASNLSDQTEEISAIQNELLHFNIKLLPPHILTSGNNFEIDGNNIRMGLSAIKGISETATTKLRKFHIDKNNKFSVFLSCDNANLDLRIMSALIFSGSMDDIITESRSKTHLELILWRMLFEKERQICLTYGEKYNNNLIEMIKGLNKDVKDAKGKPIIKDSRLETLRKKITPYYNLYRFNSKNENLAKFFFEEELLGFSYSTSLYEIYKNQIPDLVTIAECNSSLKGENVRFIARVKSAKAAKSKAGTKYYKIIAKDHTGENCNFAFSTEKRDVVEEMLENNGRLPEEKDIIVIRGQKQDGNTIFVKSLGIQDSKIFMKISEMNDNALEKGLV